MFIVTDKTTYTWPVVCSEPLSGGTFAKRRFNATFPHITQERINEVLENARLGRDQGDLVDEVFLGWGPEVAKEDKTPLEITDENKAWLLSKPWIRNGILDGFIQSITGDAARRKN